MTKTTTKKFHLKLPYWSDIYHGDKVALRLTDYADKKYAEWIVRKLNAKI